MKKDEIIETEGFRNQTLTTDAAARTTAGAGKPKKKVVALQLDEREQLALAALGGVEGLKRLLCPPDLCLGCRKGSPVSGSPYDSLCSDCMAADTSQSP